MLLPPAHARVYTKWCADGGGLPVIARSVLALTAILFAWPVQSQEAAANSSIEGRVVNLSTGAPIPGATVTLSGRARTLGPLLGAQSTIPKVKTDEQGRFVFRNLEAASYSLIAEQQGFLSAGYRSSGSHEVVLGENQVLSNALLALMPEATVAAKVMDSRGAPVTDAQVKLLRQRSTLATGRPATFQAGGCRTDSHGECRVANLNPGDYLLEASPRPRPASSRSLPRSTKPELADIVTYYPRAADPAAASALRLGPGEVRVELRLLRVATVQISGRVIDPGEGTAPPFVQLVARNAAGTSLQVEAPTSQDGPFLIRNVPPGSYYLTAQRSAPRPAQPSVSGTSRTVRITPGSLTDRPVLAAAFRPIEVRGSNLDGVDLKMEPTFNVDGVVTVDQKVKCWPRGGMGHGDPLAFLSSEIPMAARSHSTAISKDRFFLKNVAPMRYFVSLNSGNCYVKSIRYGGREAEDNLVEITGPGTLEIALSAGARINGMAVDREGRPAARATATLIPQDGRAFSRRFALFFTNGSFSLLGVPPGSYRLFVWEDSLGTEPSPELMKAFEKRAVSLTLAPGETPGPVRIEVIPAIESAKISGLTSAPPPAKAMGSIRGQVVDGVSGAPLAGAALNLKGWSGATPQASAQTDAQGRFEFPRLEPGLYNLAAEHPGYAPATTAQKEMPMGALIVGEGQQVAGIELKMRPLP